MKPSDVFTIPDTYRVADTTFHDAENHVTEHWTVTDILAKGVHVLAPDGEVDRFIPCGIAPTNCAFDGETLWVTDAGVLPVSAEPSKEGRIWRLHVPGGGAPTYRGRIATPKRMA